MRKVKFICKLAPDENVAFTAAIRDLHKCYPGQFLTDVHSASPAFWEHNPFITSLRETATDVEVIECGTQDLMDEAAQFYHILHRGVHFVNRRLGVRARLTSFKGDIYVSDLEKSWYSQITEIVGVEIPFWILAATGRHHRVGPKDARQLQKVVDHFRGRVQFVQVGPIEQHPGLGGVIDLRGQTDPRQLIRLIYHSQGVLSWDSLGRHLAAAVEARENARRDRGCVALVPENTLDQGDVYAFRQPARLPAHSGFKNGRLHRGGAPNSHSRTIRANEIIQGLQSCFDGGSLPFLSPQQARIARHILSPAKIVSFKRDSESAILRRATEKFIKTIPPFPGRFRGRGIVICAGGTYLPAAWVCINMLRKLGSRLPIQVWHLGQGETNPTWEKLINKLGAHCVNSLELRQRYPARELKGAALKAYALNHCRFRQVLLLDADMVPAVNPDFLFETSEFARTGAVFWPGLRPGLPPRVWKTFGLPPGSGPEFDPAQMLIDKRRGWPALCLALWYNEHSDFCRKHALSDRNTFQVAFRKLARPFSLVPVPARRLEGTICQHDFQGRRLFQHRNGYKWGFGGNPIVPGFLHEKDCLRFLQRLRVKWRDPLPALIFKKDSSRSALRQEYISELTRMVFEYQRVGHDCRRMSFNGDGTIGFGAASLEKFWNIADVNGQIWLEILSADHVTCRLMPAGGGQWQGRWNHYERMPVLLTREDPAPLLRGRPAATSSHRKHIFFRAPLNGYTGYGLHANQIVTDLQEMGYTLSIRAFDINETFASIPDNVRKAIACQEHPSEWELVLRPPGFTPVRGKRTVYFTMWESTRLPPHTIPLFNRSECVVVPTQWNADSLQQGGVRCPIHVVPLGIKTDIFTFAPMKMTGPCVFGTGGRLESGGARKGVNLIVQLFKKAFPSEKDVRLHVKIFPDCEVPAESDPRIRFNREYLREPEMAAWYRDLTCFVSGARGEGWGLMQHQSLATGRPLIGVCFGGTAAFFTKQIGYPADFKLVPAADLYTGCGSWAEPSEKSIVQLMRRVYRNREEARRLGIAAAAEVAGFSWLESSRKLRTVLQNVGMVD